MTPKHPKCRGSTRREFCSRSDCPSFPARRRMLDDGALEGSVPRLFSGFSGRVARYHMLMSGVYKLASLRVVAGPNKHDEGIVALWLNEFHFDSGQSLKSKTLATMYSRSGSRNTHSDNGFTVTTMCLPICAFLGCTEQPRASPWQFDRLEWASILSNAAARLATSGWPC